jgi:AcrR family transcriptional regulator
VSPTRRELVKATRARILEAAARLARERGPNGFSMDLLAKEAGVARATVYEHFRSKRAVLDELASSTSRSLALESPDTDIGDPLTALRDMLGAVCRHWHEHEEAVRELRTLVAVTGSDAPTDGVGNEYLRSLVEGLVAGGHLRPRWSAADAVDALALLTSYPTYEQLRRSHERTPEQIEAVLAKVAVSIVSPSA